MIMYYFFNPADALEIRRNKKMAIIWARIPDSQAPPTKGKSSYLAWGKRRKSGGGGGGGGGREEGKSPDLDYDFFFGC